MAGRSSLHRALLIAAALVAIAFPAPAHASHGSFTRHTYPSAGAPGAREYWLYVPPGTPAGSRPLVVYLHGCLQSALEAARQTRFNELADQRGFVVAYPQQLVASGSSAPLVDGNGAGCWNWFLPEDQVRDSGEAATIAGLTREIIASQNIDPERVYVDGISAGADMAVIMGATHPDLYAALGALAGCAYATCSDESGALAYAAMGPRARVVPMLVEQGTADTLNVYALAQGLVEQWLGTGDIADDGLPNGSISRVPSSIDHHGFEQTPQPGSGDLCVRNNNWPCPGGAIGFRDTYPYSVEHFRAAGCEVLDFWIIHGMEHAYPRSSPSDHFGDPLGPDMTAAAYDFFMRHTLSAPCAG